jgi:hypothetical protein
VRCHVPLDRRIGDASHRPPSRAVTVRSLAHRTAACHVRWRRTAALSGSLASDLLGVMAAEPVVDTGWAGVDAPARR